MTSVLFAYSSNYCTRVKKDFTRGVCGRWGSDAPLWDIRGFCDLHRWVARQNTDTWVYFFMEICKNGFINTIYAIIMGMPPQNFYIGRYFPYSLGRTSPVNPNQVPSPPPPHPLPCRGDFTSFPRRKVFLTSRSSFTFTNKRVFIS